MRIVNRAAHARYTVVDKKEAGIALTGPEVKSVRQGHVDLTSAYALIRGKEVFLLNAKIAPYKFARNEDYNPGRTRKLLLHKKEIQSLETKIEAKNLTLIPLSMYTIGALIKVELALAKGKKTHQRKEELKRKAVDRDIEREIARRG